MNNWLSRSKKKLLMEADSTNQFTAKCTVDVNFDMDAVYKGKFLSNYNYYDVTTVEVKYTIEFDMRSWGLKDISVYNPKGDKTIDFMIDVEEGDEEESIDFVGMIDWDLIVMEREYGSTDTTMISPNQLELHFDKDCKLIEGTVIY